MITGAAGRGRTAKGGSVNGLDPRSGKVLWTYTNWQNIIPVPQAVDAGEGRVLITGAYGAGSAMIKVDKKGDGTYAVSELFKNPDFGAHTQPPVLHDGHFYSHYTINERSDGLVAMSMDGQVKWKTDQQPPFVRGGSILADGLLLMTDGNTKLYLVEPNPTAIQAAGERRDSRAGRQLGAAGARRRQAAGARTKGAEGSAGRAVSARPFDLDRRIACGVLPLGTKPSRDR